MPSVLGSDSFSKFNKCWHFFNSGLDDCLLFLEHLGVEALIMGLSSYSFNFSLIAEQTIGLPIIGYL